MTSKSTVFKITDTLLTIPGVNLKDQNRFANIRLAISFVIFSVISILAVTEVVVTYKSIETLGKAEIAPLFLMNVLTICCYISSQTRWKNVILDIEEKFWDFNTFETTLLHQQNAISYKILQYLKIYLITFLPVNLLFYVKPAFFRKLPFLIHPFCDMSGTTCYVMVYIFEIIAQIFSAPFVLGFNALLIYQVLCVYLELDAINYSLSKIDCEERQDVVEKEIYKLVEHHGVVLEVMNNLRKLWSEIILMVYWMSTLTICLGFFLMCINGIPPSFDDFVKYGSFIVAFANLLFVYCIAGTILMEQSTSVSKAAFEVNWWVKTQPNVRRSLALMIQRANKPGILDVGGVTPMTLVSFPQILKTSFSFFTLMQNLEEGKDIPEIEDI